MLPMITVKADTVTETYMIGHGVVIPNINAPADGSNRYCNCGKTVGTGKHYCCWNYAFYVYYHVWGERPDRRDESTNYLRFVPAEDRTLTIEHLQMYLRAAAPGALFRIDRASDPASGDSNGHSLVFVKMNDAGDGAFFLEGNYDGMGRSRLVEWSFDSLVASYGPDSGSAYGYIKYILWPDAPEYTSYLSFSEKYPCGVTLAITEDTVAYTLPCNSTVAESYGDVSTELTDKPLVAGTEVTATALYKNTEGEFWYKIGTNEYVLCEKTVVTDVISPWIDGGSFPSTIKGSTNIKGTVRSGGGDISALKAVVYANIDTDTDNEPILSSDTVAVCGDEYTLKYSTVDRSLPFSQLAKIGSGDYTLSYIVTVCSYYMNGDELCQTEITTELGGYAFYYENPCTHSYTTVTVDPTCTEQGYTEYTCGDCGYAYVHDRVDAKGHGYVDGVCVDCGEREYICGDVNIDGEVTAVDAAMAYAAVNGKLDLDETQLWAADVNGDGEVTAVDAAMIYAYVNGKLLSFPAE